MEFWVKQIEIKEFWCLENGTWITWTQIRQINNPQTSGRWCLCLHNLNKTMLHMWPMKWEEIKCHWQWVVMTEQEEEKKAEFWAHRGKAGTCREKGWLFICGRDGSFAARGIGACFLPSKKEISPGWQWFNWDGCSSLWAARPGDAANEVPECRRFVCLKSLSAENWTRQGCIGTAVCGKGKARSTFSSSLEFSMTFPLQAVQGEETKAHPKEEIYEIWTF